jgi:hypothetical protein
MVYNVTRREQEFYCDFILRCNKNLISQVVKLADLEDNLRPSRILLRNETYPQDIKCIKKYYLAHMFLTGRITEEEYTISQERGS